MGESGGDRFVSRWLQLRARGWLCPRPGPRTQPRAPHASYCERALTQQCTRRLRSSARRSGAAPRGRLRRRLCCSSSRCCLLLRPAAVGCCCCGCVPLKMPLLLFVKAFNASYHFLDVELMVECHEAGWRAGRWFLWRRARFCLERARGDGGAGPLACGHPTSPSPPTQTRFAPEDGSSTRTYTGRPISLDKQAPLRKHLPCAVTAAAAAAAHQSHRRRHQGRRRLRHRRRRRWPDARAAPEPRCGAPSPAMGRHRRRCCCCCWSQRRRRHQRRRRRQRRGCRRRSRARLMTAPRRRSSARARCCCVQRWQGKAFASNVIRGARAAAQKVTNPAKGLHSALTPRRRRPRCRPGHRRRRAARRAPRRPSCPPG